MIQKRRRFRLLLDRFQYRLVSINALYSGIVAVLFSFLLFGPLVQQLLLSDPDPAARDRASSEFLTLHQRIWPPLILAFIGLTIHTLVESHRIAGPLCQFRRLFGRLRDGDLTARARLRKNDYLTAEAEVFNEMGASLERRLLETQKSGLDLCAGLDSLKRELSTTGPSPDLVKLVEILDQRADRFRSAIVPFKTAPVDGVESATVQAPGITSSSWETDRAPGGVAVAHEVEADRALGRVAVAHEVEAG